MPTYLMLSTLGPDGFATLSEHPDRLRQVTEDVEAMGVTVVAQYALLGEYDFLNIIEAPDETAMARVATTLAARGTMRTRTITAMAVDEYLEALGAANSDGSVPSSDEG